MRCTSEAFCHDDAPIFPLSWNSFVVVALLLAVSPLCSCMANKFKCDESNLYG